MHFLRPILSSQRLKRIHRWALLWLTWFAAFLEAAACAHPLARQAENVAHAWLDKFERLITNIIMIEAAARVRFAPAPRGFVQHARIGRGVRRAVLGVRVRRALSAKHPRARADALRRELAPLIDVIVRRLPRGLTRRAPVRVNLHSNEALSEMLASAPAQFADSS